MYKEIFDKLTDAILIIEDDKFVYCNEAVVMMLGYKDKKEFLNTNPAELSPEYQPDGLTSREKVMQNTKVVLNEGHRTFEWVHLRATGEPFWVEVQLSDMKTDAKVTFLVVWKEIGEKKRLEKENKYQEMVLNSVLNSSDDLIFYKDYVNEGGKYIGCNKAFSSYVGKEIEDIVGCTDLELFGKEKGTLIRNKDQSMIDENKTVLDEEWATYPNGKRVLLNILKSLLKDDSGKTIGLLGIARDMTTDYNYKETLKRSIKEQKELASIDALTGIKNRRSFFEVSEEIFEISKRTNLSLSLLMIDIDLFKNINDTYGHIIGDDILKYIANTVSERLRQSDIFARYGGEEFIVLLPDTDLKGSLEIGEEICSLFSNNVYSDGKISVKVTISIGVSQFTDELFMRQFIQKADLALYKAK
ncbi:diguanylate cyclase, partial [Sulfurimonas sp. SAG-AH-194-L11]